MSAPLGPWAPARPAPAAAPPPLASGRVHAVVALSVIATIGLAGALLAWLTGLQASSTCSSPPLPYASPNAFCGTLFHAFVTWSTPIAVALACGLAIVGIVRARHLWAFAAWGVYVGFCVVWWTVLSSFG